MAQSILMQMGSPQKYLLEILKSYPHLKRCPYLKTHPRHTYILTSTKIEEESNKLSFKSMFSSLSNCFIVCPSVADIAKYVSDDRLDWAVKIRQTGDDPFFIIWTFSFFVSRNWNGLWRRGRRPLLHHLHCSSGLLQTMGNQYGHWFADTSINRPLTNPLFSVFFTPVTEALKV